MPNFHVEATKTEAISSTGLTTVVPHPSPELDIVFVHGFTGHPERTWTHTRGSRSSLGSESDSISDFRSKPRRLSLLSKIYKDPDTTSSPVYWPRDLLPSDVPNARVLTYGYDTHVKHWAGAPPSHNNVRDFAWDMLVALESRRRGEPARPLVFVVHSLGGIVVKEMLRRSHRCGEGQDHLRDVFSSTRGIMFFGTPHGGADPRGVLQRTAESLVRAVGFKANEHVLNSMLPSSERLRELRDEFNPIAHEQEWMIHSFQEELGMKALGDRKIVDDNSSYLNFPAIETTEHIRRNHRNMCRFSGPEDPEYKKVVAALHRITENPQKTRSSRHVVLLTDEQKTKLQNAMGFSQINARQMNIKNAHNNTCRWLNQKQEYLDWLDPDKMEDHHGFLWIKGKPGTGKSTLMKFSLAQAEETAQDTIIVSFFFNARGAELEKSTAGMYRSFLLQLVDHVPEVGPLVYNASRLESWWPEQGAVTWTVEALKDILEKAIHLLAGSKIMFFIDALDECDESQIRNMISFFEQVGDPAVASQRTLRLCLASRHYPHVTVTRAREIILEGQDGHNNDIQDYVISELKIGNTKVAEEIRAEIRARSSGIFLWVALVVGILNKEYDRGRVFALRKRLQEIPNGLHDLFKDILTRNTRDKEELVYSLQWILFAEQPLRPEQFYFAVLARMDPHTLEPWDNELVTESTLRRFVLDCSKGLADVTKSKEPVVQFIHESVRDFLLGGNGLCEIWPGDARDFRSTSHDQLKKCCLQYVSLLPSSQYQERFMRSYDRPTLYTPAPKAPLIFPFMEYAIYGTMHHAGRALCESVCQVDFLRSFPITTWSKATGIFHRPDRGMYRKDPNLLYILTRERAPDLARLYLRTESLLKLDEDLKEALTNAVSNKSDDVVVAIAEAELRRDRGSGTSFRALCQKYLQNPNNIPEPDTTEYFKGAIIGFGIFDNSMKPVSGLEELGDVVGVRTYIHCHHCHDEVNPVSESLASCKC